MIADLYIIMHILCLDIFVVYLLVYLFAINWFTFQIFIAAFALVYGNPLRLVNGYDSFGNVCGSSNADVIDQDVSGGGGMFLGYDATDLK